MLRFLFLSAFVFSYSFAHGSLDVSKKALLRFEAIDSDRGALLKFFSQNRNSATKAIKVISFLAKVHTRPEIEGAISNRNLWVFLSSFPHTSLVYAKALSFLSTRINPRSAPKLLKEAFYLKGEFLEKSHLLKTWSDAQKKSFRDSLEKVTLNPRLVGSFSSE